MNPTINCGLHNRFDIEVQNTESGEIKKYYAENIILDQLWTNIGTSWNQYIHFGSGVATPQATDTSLTTFVGAKVAPICEFDYDNNNVFRVKRSITILENEYVDYTFSEVGIGSSTSSNLLMTKALILTSQGQPTSFIKSNTDVVIIYATVYIKTNTYANNSIGFFGANPFLMALSGSTGTNETSLAGAFYLNAGYFSNFNIKSNRMNRSSGNSSDSYTCIFDATGVLDYNATSKTITATFARAKISDGTENGYGSIVTYSGGRYSPLL